MNAKVLIIESYPRIPFMFPCSLFIVMEKFATVLLSIFMVEEFSVEELYDFTIYFFLQCFPSELVYCIPYFLPAKLWESAAKLSSFESKFSFFMHVLNVWFRNNSLNLLKLQLQLQLLHT